MSIKNIIKTMVYNYNTGENGEIICKYCENNFGNVDGHYQDVQPECCDFICLRCGIDFYHHNIDGSCPN